MEIYTNGVEVMTGMNLGVQSYRFVAGLKAGLIGSVMATHITAQTYLIVLISTSVLKRLIIVRYLDTGKLMEIYTNGVEVMTGMNLGVQS
jgi:hypothetical protein